MSIFNSFKEQRPTRALSVSLFVCLSVSLSLSLSDMIQKECAQKAGFIHEWFGAHRSQTTKKNEFILYFSKLGNILKNRIFDGTPSPPIEHAIF